MRQTVFLTTAFLAAAVSAAQSPEAVVDPQIETYSTLLGVDLRERAFALANFEHPPQMQSVKLDVQQVSFSSGEGKKEDYLLHIDIETGWKDHTTVLLVFVPNEKAYKEAFGLELRNKGFGDRIKPVDVDTDARMEMLLETDTSGNQSTDIEMTIWRFENGRFNAIFEQTLDKCFSGNPYSILNRYRFVPNPTNPKLRDIELVVRTSYDDSRESLLDPEERKKLRKLKVADPVSEKYRFTFDGTKYVADRPVYDYEAPFQTADRRMSP